MYYNICVDNKMGIYNLAVTKPDGTEKIYVGSTNDLRMRCMEHFRTLDRNKHTNKYLQNTYNKHITNKFIVNLSRIPLVLA